MDSIDQRLAHLAEPHAGAFRVDAAIKLGITRVDIRCRCKRGSAYRRHPGTYVLGCDLHTPDTECWAALLAAGPGTLLTRESAAFEWGFSRARTCPPPELLVGHRHRPLAGVSILQSRTIRRDDRAIRNGRPTASPERTIVDLADVRTMGQLGRYLREAAFRELLDIERLRHTMDRNQNRRGSRRLAMALVKFLDGDLGSDNWNEERFVRLLHHAGITDAVANKELLISGTLVRPDVWIEHAGLAVELDEFSHGIPVVIREDALKEALLRSAGIPVVRADDSDLPGGVVIVQHAIATLSSASHMRMR
jgi:hypothetical protein